MCLIIHKPKNKRIPAEYIRNAMQLNPHGFGITWLDNGETERTLDYANIERLLDTDRPYVCHFRFATVGKVNKPNCHPFEITNAPRYVIYSNGTVDGYGNVHCSDIRMIADKVLGTMHRNKWVPFLQQSDTRFAIVDTINGKVQRINHWHEKDGIYYSKANCFGSHRVAVYGTLKWGYGNHRLLENSQLVGDGRTKDLYPLEVSGLPYLHDEQHEGHQVEVEVYDVDDTTLEWLDSLEGHPNFYRRKQIPISMEDWTETTAWVYFVQNRRLPSEYHWTNCYVGEDWEDSPMSSTEFVYR